MAPLGNLSFAVILGKFCLDFPTYMEGTLYTGSLLLYISCMNHFYAKVNRYPTN